jgi:hypothetical protein
VTHRSRRWGNCRSAQPNRDAARARRDGSVAGVECKSGFRQTWGWLGGITSLLLDLINFDGPPTAASVVLNEILRSNDCAGSTVRRGGYLVDRADS